MPLKKNMMKKNLENLPLKERINYGYRKVITMMLISGLFSIVVMGILFANMLHYLQKCYCCRPGGENLQDKC